MGAACSSEENAQPVDTKVALETVDPIPEQVEEEKCAEEKRAQEEAEKKQREEEEKERARQAEAEKQKKLAAAQAEAKRKLEREQLEKQKQQQEQQAAQEAALKKQQQEEEEERARQQAAAEEKKRLEEARKAEEAKKESEAAAAKKKEQENKAKDLKTMKDFLTTGSFEDVNAKKKTSALGSYTFPLHTAVKQNDPELVRILLENGADIKLETKGKKTALDKAEKINIDGSHGKVISFLKSRMSQPTHAA